MSALYAIAAAVLAAILGVRLYNALTGRRLSKDLRDKRRLRARSLEDWDAFCVANPRNSDIVVCLTTTPSRIHLLADTLASLMWQSRRPRRIRLHVPDVCVRDGTPYEIPKAFEQLQSVDIVRCHDDGPATKLIPALHDLPPDQWILVVDDDMIYPPDMIEAFGQQSQSRPGAAHALSGWIVPDDLTDRPTNLLSNVLQYPPVPLKCSRIWKERQIDILQGYAGFLVRPRFFDLDALTDYTLAPEQARTVDDVWLSGHCQADKFVFPYDRYPFNSWRNHPHYVRTSLGRINRGDGDPSRRPNTIVVKHLRDAWMTTRRRSVDGRAVDGDGEAPAGHAAP